MKQFKLWLDFKKWIGFDIVKCRVCGNLTENSLVEGDICSRECYHRWMDKGFNLEETKKLWLKRGRK